MNPERWCPLDPDLSPNYIHKVGSSELVRADNAAYLFSVHENNVFHCPVTQCQIKVILRKGQGNPVVDEGLIEVSVLKNTGVWIYSNDSLDFTSQLAVQRSCRPGTHV
jgi:hypothetical protein